MPTFIRLESFKEFAGRQQIEGDGPPTPLVFDPSVETLDAFQERAAAALAARRPARWIRINEGASLRTGETVGSILFENGSVWRSDMNNQDPPQDRRALLEIKLRFAEASVAFERAQLSEMLQSISDALNYAGRYKNVMPPNEADIEMSNQALNVQEEKIADLEAMVLACQAELETLKPEAEKERDRRMAAWEDEKRQRLSAATTALRNRNIARIV